MKCIYSVIRELLIQWSHDANKTDVNPDNVDTKIVKGITGRDMNILFSSLSEVIQRGEYIEEMIEENFIHWLLEAIMTNESYPVYLKIPEIRWNAVFIVQLAINVIVGENLQRLVDNKRLLLSVGSAIRRLGEGDDIKHAVLLVTVLNNLIINSNEMSLKICKNEGSVFEALIVLFDAVCKKLKKLHKVC
jgi:hypothetical protein